MFELRKDPLRIDVCCYVLLGSTVALHEHKWYLYGLGIASLNGVIKARM